MTTFREMVQEEIERLAEAEERARAGLVRVRRELSEYAMSPEASGVEVAPYVGGLVVTHLGRELFRFEPVEGVGFAVYGPSPDDDDAEGEGTLMTDDVEEALRFAARITARAVRLGGDVVVTVPAA